jgi:Fic family protein
MKTFFSAPKEMFDNIQLENLENKIQEIIDYKNKWNIIKHSVDKKTYKKIIKEMKIYFVYFTCQGENIGSKNWEETQKIISQQETNQFQTLTKDQKETLNLSKAWDYIYKIIIEKENLGLLTIAWLQEIHKVCMHDILPKGSTEAGKFSFYLRSTWYNEKEHFYPCFSSNEEWEEHFLRIFDKYNPMIELIKKDLKQNDSLAISRFLKCSAWVMEKILSLHPFADGNGRTCRLLIAYSMLIINPFPVPIYDEHLSFIDSIVKARQGNLQELISLILNSLLTTYKYFFSLLALHKCNNGEPMCAADCQ